MSICDTLRIDRRLGSKGQIPLLGNRSTPSAPLAAPQTMPGPSSRHSGERVWGFHARGFPCLTTPRTSRRIEHPALVLNHPHNFHKSESLALQLGKQKLSKRKSCNRKCTCPLLVYGSISKAVGPGLGWRSATNRGCEVTNQESVLARGGSSPTLCESQPAPRFRCLRRLPRV